MIEILKSHPDFYVVNKPSGLGMHSEGDTAGVIVLLERQIGESLFPVHRLDKETSGLLIVARNKSAARDFGRLFEAHAIDKYYLAIGGNKPKKKQGLIQGDMTKSRNGSWMLCKTMHNPATTQFFSYGTGLGFRVYLLRPLSGKTHQLRVALKSLSAPIWGDSRYGGDAAPRLMLHAMALRFHWHNESFSFIALPASDQGFIDYDWRLIDGLQQPWQQPWPQVKSKVSN
ncbi:MAG: RNA pseudouridine synthase [Aliidiomarina sp.]|uniref:pseudouridine synthase n=1 Tax=Aliidiomarina sp. TaxID=1872439 RepID=UPI0025BA84B2|nr:pseudouridine synthase [Aliidiomarina sp.]MCH8500826.1 RNA pseudouridine synthase [Aliidiomarina sp.]